MTDNTPVTTTYTPAALAAELTPAVTYAADLEEQATRAVINSEESLNAAADFMRLCTAALKRANEKRISQVKPLNDHVTWINSQWKTMVVGRIEAAKEMVEGRATKYAKEQQAIRQAEQDDIRRQFEAQALADAAAAEEAGRNQEAEQIVEAAAATPIQAPAKVMASGSFTGATASLRARWEGSVDDDNINLVCLAIANGDLPASIIQFKKAELNKVATTVGKAGSHFGITVTDASKLVAR